MNNQIMFLVGPTAAGKTAISIILAKKINAEIISCDSMQVYKHMDIITQKPPKSYFGQIRHHLIDCLEPSQQYSAAIFREKALILIDEIFKRGRNVLFAGGSGLYVKALVDGLFFAQNSPDLSLRANLYKEALSSGPEKLYSRLKTVDAASAEKIHPNNIRRVVRALEVYQTTNVPMSTLKKYTEGIWVKFDIKIFGITRPRNILYKRIDDRVDKMFEQGLVDEAKGLLKKEPSQTASGALGIKEVKGYLDGEYSLDQAKILLKRNTRHFAKRQLTWFRPDARIKWIEINNDDSDEKVAGYITASIK